MDSSSSSITTFINQYGLLLFLIIPAIVISFVSHYFRKKAIEEAWRKFAGEKSLTFNQGSFFANPRVTGKIEEFDFELYTYTRSSGTGAGRSSRTYTGFKMILPKDAPCNLHLYREGSLGSMLDKAFGGQDIQLDDAEFDRAFLIKSDNAASAQQVIDGDLRWKLLEDRRLLKHISVENNEVSCEYYGRMTDLQKLNYVFDLMLLIARNASKDGG